MSAGQRERYDQSIAMRLSLLAEQGLDTCVDALQAMTWATPDDDELTLIYAEANQVGERLDNYRGQKGYRHDS